MDHYVKIVLINYLNNMMTQIYKLLLKINLFLLIRMKKRIESKNKCKNCLIALSLVNMYNYNRHTGFNVNNNNVINFNSELQNGMFNRN